MSDVLLRVEGATKRFGAVSALADVDLTLHEGQVLALLGDNGAGKSTLIKCLSGVHTLDEGRITLNGEQIAPRSPAESRAAGIETVYQDLALFDNLDAAANLYAGRELRRLPLVRWASPLKQREMSQRAATILRDLQVGIKDPSMPVGFMSGGQRQAIAVARAYAFARKVVILDEPTAALGLRESRQVLDLIRSLPQRGIAVILISHNMEEVMNVADDAVVLRQGERVGSCAPTRENHHRLVSMIVGSADVGPPAFSGNSTQVSQ